MPPPLAKRYFYKLLANMASVPVYLAMEAILPRALGPQLYGNYNFSTNLFLQLSGFLDMGSSTCFYNYLSRSPHSTALFAFYVRIAIFLAIALFLAGLIAFCKPVGNYLLPDVPLWFAPFSAFWAYLTWLGRVLRSTNDALGVTIPSEMWRAALSIIGVIILGALFFTHTLNLRTLFAQQYLLLAGTALAFWLVSKKYWRGENIKIHYRLSQESKKEYSKIFINYSHPLFVQALLSFFMLTTERWLLQWFDGSAQQGFYALSQKVSMACFLFVSAMTPLLMRELSVAWGKGDVKAMGGLLTRFAPALYTVAAYFSCFTMAEGKALVHIFGGAEFAAAVLPVQIMALYPLHQAYGQMATSVFHACAKTKILRNLTACECAYGLMTTWFLLAPQHLYGLNLGAAGLAIKTVIVQFLSVNICLWLVSRTVPFAFWKNLFHQLWSVCILGFLAFACRAISLDIPGFDENSLWRFVASGICYSFFAAIAVIIAPRLLGMSHSELKDISKRIFGSMNFLKGK